MDLFKRIFRPTGEAHSYDTAVKVRGPEDEHAHMRSRLRCPHCDSVGQKKELGHVQLIRGYSHYCMNNMLCQNCGKLFAAFYELRSSLSVEQMKSMTDGWRAAENLDFEDPFWLAAQGDVRDLHSLLQTPHLQANDHYMQGCEKMKQEDLSGALSQFREAIRLRPRFAEAHTNLGAVFHDQGRHQEAAEAFRTAISIKPDLAVAHSGLGSALLALGQGDEAIRECHEAVHLDPNYAGGYYNLALALRARRRYPEAIEAFRGLLRVEPNGEWADRARSFIQEMQRWVR